MVRVKIIYEGRLDLEKQINNFLESNSVEKVFNITPFSSGVIITYEKKDDLKELEI